MADANMNNVAERQRCSDVIYSTLSDPGNSCFEQVLAANMAPAVAMKCGGADIILVELKPVLLEKAEGKTVAAQLRARCCYALSLIQVMCDEYEDSNIDEAVYFMEKMEDIFADVAKINANNAINAFDDVSQVHTAALNAWSLLAAWIPAVEFCTLVYHRVSGIPTIESFVDLLKSQHSGVRVATAKAIAVFIENGRRYDAGFLDGKVSDVVKAIKPMIGCNTGKEDDILCMVLRYLLKEKQPVELFDFEVLQPKLLTWANHMMIGACEEIIGTDMNKQLEMAVKQFVNKKLNSNNDYYYQYVAPPGI